MHSVSFATVALAAALFQACASTTGDGMGVSGSSGPVSGQIRSTFERRLVPFEVLDTNGTPYTYPFLGGLNVPRPQVIDIDGDGDADLMVQEQSNAIMFFETVTNGRESELVWRTDKFQNLDVGEWYRFADLDGDGDLDLLAEQPFSYIRYYRNDGRPGRPEFVTAADTLKDTAGEPIFSDRQNIPNITDLNCDGRLDLLIGRLTGTVSHYREVERDPRGVPSFELVTDRFEDIEIVAQIGSLHGANTMALADIDHDGDQDLFWGDFFEPGVLYIENTGTCERPVLRGEPVPFPPGDPLSTSGYNAPTVGDWDGDGDLDMFVGVVGGAYNLNRTLRENLLYLEQTAPMEFTLRTRAFLRHIDVGSESHVAAVDWDGDGDYDLIISNKIDPDDLQTSRMYLFENIGTTREPRFAERGPLNIRGSYHYAPAFGDLDGDGDLDMILGTWRDELAFYRNEGDANNPRWVLEESAIVKLTRGSNATPALVDIDGDGDLDLFVGESSGSLNYYRNDGTASEPAFVFVSDSYNGIDIGRRSVPSFADVDGDGDWDLLIGRDAGGFAFYRNAGSTTNPVFVADSSLAIDTPGFSTPVMVDMDGDGDLDFLSGGVGGGVVYYENVQTEEQ
jgi:uncharacterized protein (DUF2141 family)